MDEKTKILSEQMEEELLNASKDAIECIMMSAYLNDYGADLLVRLSRNIIKQSKEVPIKVLISDHFAQSFEEKIRILKRLREVEGLEVRIHQGEHFLHAKSYIFRVDKEIRAMIGSNNLTYSGLSRNFETAIITVRNESDAEINELISKFDEYWKEAKRINSKEGGEDMLKGIPKFEKGDNVINKVSKEVGTVNDILKGAREIQYRVTFTSEGKKVTIAERDLERYVDIEEKIEEDFINGKFGSFDDYKLFHTWLRLNLPLENNLYSYLGSKTLFNPYQFKPLMRFLSQGSEERLFIADEVGVGKTIETGIILTELLSRNRLDFSTPVIVVCPDSLMQKWKREMKERFNLNFHAHDGRTLLDMLRGIKTDGVVPENYRFSIAGLQLFRSDKYLHLLKEITENRRDPIFGLVAIDEAHHLRNIGTNSYELGSALSESTEMMLMLSATPLNLSNNDLFNQLHILNPSIFSDFETFQNLQNPVKRINKIIRLIYEFPSSREDIISEMDELNKDQIGSILLKREWVRNFRERIAQIKKLDLPEAVDIERRFSSLNPLYGSFTRTRKREAIEHQVKREARELPIKLSEEELSFQEEILEAIRSHFMNEGYDQSVLMLIMNTHRRMLSSSIPMMRKYLKWVTDNRKVEVDSPIGGDDFREDDSDCETVDIDERLKEKFETLLKKAEKLEKTDNKYIQFRKLLETLIDNKSVKQVIVFSFFIHTLEYLKDRLSRDGYTVEMIHGKIPDVSVGSVEGREEIMERFEKGEFKILLSSEVGGEGLDFQFCNAIINYDLPYNPMKIEQRIGRIDRFGQKSDKIIIVNLFITGTVDEEIYERLYKRIRLVEDGIGALEPIMGKQISEFQQALLTGTLSKDEQDEYQGRIESAIEHSKAEMRSFEDRRRELLNDDFLSKPINELGPGNFVNPEDAILLTKFFLQQDKNSFLTLNEKGHEKGLQMLSLSKEIRNELDVFLRTREGKQGYLELSPLIKSSNPVPVIFDGSSFEKFSNCVFLPPTGFWSKFITSRLKEDNVLKRVFRFKAICKGEGVPKGDSLIFLFQVKFEGLRNQIELVAIPVEVGSKESIGKAEYENLARTLSNCEGTDVELSPSQLSLKEFLDTSRFLLGEYLESKIKLMSEENSSLLNARITALETSRDQRIQKNNKEIETHIVNRTAENKEPDENYIRLTRAKIDKDRRLTNEKVEDLRKHQNLVYTYSLEGVVLLAS